MKIAVLGSGSGGCALAFDLAYQGNTINMYDFSNYEANINAIKQNGGIFAEGEYTGFAKINHAGFEINEVIKDAELIFVVAPAYAAVHFASVCRNIVTKDQPIILCPGNIAGSFEFKKNMNYDLFDRSITIAETATLPYACRLIEPGRINIILKIKKGIKFAAFPSDKTKKLLQMLNKYYTCFEEASNVMEISLQNANPVLHPPIMLLNTTKIENPEEDFYFYKEGITGAVSNIISAIDNERINIGTALGLDIKSDPEMSYKQEYISEVNYDTGYKDSKIFSQIKAPPSLNHRYIDEDIGYGLVFWSLLGDHIGVDTPTIDSIIALASVMNNKNYYELSSRTITRLGLDEYPLNSIMSF